MGFLANKKILITGLLSSRSIAHGIAKAAHREGAQLAFSYQGEKIKDRVVELAEEFGSKLIFPCDVSSDEEIAAMFASLRASWDGLDGLVHSIAFAPREALSGDYIDTISRESFRIAHDVSAYSFGALAKAALPMMQGRNGALLTLTYLGSERAFVNYNVMGLAKASLEANVRYLAQSLGPRGIRVNAVSAGPIKTLAAAGIGSFGKLLSFSEKQSPLRRNVSIDEVGNVAAFLLSDLASGVTGEITFVDAGFNTTGIASVE
jgi:enoyl-[acyl-carrier protein] reductase I